MSEPLMLRIPLRGRQVVHADWANYSWEAAKMAENIFPWY